MAQKFWSDRRVINQWPNLSRMAKLVSNTFKARFNSFRFLAAAVPAVQLSADSVELEGKLRL